MSAATHDMGMSEAERRARLERALEWGGPSHRVSDVVELVKAGKAQFWQRGDGMIITEIEQYPLIKTVRYWLIWGSLEDCLALDDEISGWAREQGCTVATATGRRGWGRVSQPLGWKPHLFTFYKPLKPEDG